MHIPDGYLSPATCAALYAGAAPFWYVAVRRTKRLPTAWLVPLISLFAAFTFVVMMFNLPLPGGTTGHATGVAIAAVVLGPWASMLAVSIALLIQAIFFGDGGITAFGANAFNIAIAGSLAAYAVYRLLAGRAPILSARRVLAAGLAGYVSINLAALLAAVEFGIQPMFFRDAAGAPLYAPYPLSIAIPAMMIGHLTFAGIAELMLSAGVMAYLQRSQASLLLRTAPGVAAPGDDALPETRGVWLATRPLWIALAALMLLTPLGVLTVGKAWGEWSPRELADPAKQIQIAAASRNQWPPPRVPSGLERLSSVWTAPFPDYAPPMVRSAAFGYILSAMFGSGLVIAVWLLAAFFASKTHSGSG